MFEEDWEQMKLNEPGQQKLEGQNSRQQRGRQKPRPAQPVWTEATADGSKTPAEGTGIDFCVQLCSINGPVLGTGERNTNTAVSFPESERHHMGRPTLCPPADSRCGRPGLTERSPRRQRGWVHWWQSGCQRAAGAPWSCLASWRTRCPRRPQRFESRQRRPGWGRRAAAGVACCPCPQAPAGRVGQPPAQTKTRQKSPTRESESKVWRMPLTW